MMLLMDIQAHRTKQPMNVRKVVIVDSCPVLLSLKFVAICATRDDNISGILLEQK